MLSGLTSKNSTTGKSVIPNSKFAILGLFLFLIIFSIGFFGGADAARAADPGTCLVNIVTTSTSGPDGNIRDTTSQKKFTVQQTVCNKDSSELKKLANLRSNQAISSVEWLPATVADENGYCIVTDKTMGSSGKVVAQIPVKRSGCNYNSLKSANPSFKDEPAFGYVFSKQLTSEIVDTAGGKAKIASSFDQLVEGKACINFTKLDLAGCALKFLYTVIHGTMAGLLWVSAKFFDHIISISLSSALFKETFVSEAWAVVRDLSNLFFIIALLYVAFELILGIGHGGKKVISNIVIMALLINFSFFFTGVIIDTSNILALVFYNKLDVSYTKPDGAPAEPPGTKVTTEKELSAKMADSFKLTKLMSADTFKSAGEQLSTIPGTSQRVDGRELPTSVMIWIVLISIVIMAFATYAFLVAGLSFVGRLIQLFVLIIFSPFAFMSFAVPWLKVESISWDSWSKQLLKSAFMAPIFLFFLYFIFLMINGLGKDMAVSLLRPGEGSLIAKIISYTLPAIIILMLMLKAVSYAKKGAGEIGAMAVKGVQAAAALALGGAAVGGALALRSSVGAGTAALSRRSEAKRYGKEMFDYDKKLKAFQHSGQQGPPPPPPQTPTNLLDRLGARINKAQWKSGDVAHARHEMDELKKKAGVDALSGYQISGVDEQRMESTFVKDKRSEIESEVRKGHDAKGKSVNITAEDARDEHGNYYEDEHGNRITAVGEGGYKEKRRQRLINDAVAAGAPLGPNGELSDQEKKKVEDKLNQEFNEILRKAGERIGKEKYAHLAGEAQEKVGIINKGLARSTSGTYDIRNLANIKPDKREAMLGLKGLGMLTAAVATGIRFGMKKATDIDTGTPKGNFMEDFKKVVSEAMKNVNVKVDLGSHGGGGHGGGHDDHGTGGGGHH